MVHLSINWYNQVASDIQGCNSSQEVKAMFGKLGGRKATLNMSIDGFCVSFRCWGHRVTIG